jgi:hypothetical protein
MFLIVSFSRSTWLDGKRYPRLYGLIADGKACPLVRRLFEFVDQSDGVVLKRDPKLFPTLLT